MPRRAATLVLLACLSPLPVAALDLGYQGWGMRVGATASPSAIVVGAEVDLGNLTKRLRLVPSLDLASASDTTVLSLALPVHWHVTDQGELRPYVGAGVVATALDLESQLDDQRGVDVGAFALLGAGYQRSTGLLFLEASLASGDAYRVKVVVGWRF